MTEPEFVPLRPVPAAGAVSASVVGPCTVCGTDAGGNRMLCFFAEVVARGETKP